MKRFYTSIHNKIQNAKIKRLTEFDIHRHGNFFKFIYYGNLHIPELHPTFNSNPAVLFRISLFDRSVHFVMCTCSKVHVPFSIHYMCAD